MKQCNGINRREAARLIGAITAGLLLPIGAARTETASESLTMLTRAITSSCEKVPVIGLFTWQTFDVDLASSERKALEDVLSLFVKLGVSVLVPSRLYGPAEQDVRYG